MMQHKKTQLVQARVPFGVYRKWVRLCKRERLTSSEALRQAMAAYAGSLRDGSVDATPE